jgi:hypothetical protein
MAKKLTKPPALPEKAKTYLDFLGLIGLLRITLFEAFGDRKYWDERYFDLFTSMLLKQLRGSVVTLEEMTASMTNISHSTKIRMIEEARKDGMIISVNRSQIALDGPLDNAGARKVFFLSEETMDAIVVKLNDMMSDVEAFAAQHAKSDEKGADAA